MALEYLRLLRVQQPEFFEKYFRLYNAAGLERPTVVAHAVRIQRLWRGHRDRKYIRFLSDNARTIQRVYRGHRGRQRASEARQKKREEQARGYYDAMATLIQKVWRGVRSRGNRLNFYERKAKIAEETLRGQQLKDEIALKAEENRAKLAADTLAQHSAEFAKVTAGLHHMLSTRAQPGFFRSPFGQEFDPTAFGVPIEVHLKHAFTREYPNVRRQQKQKRVLTATGASMASANSSVRSSARGGGGGAAGGRRGIAAAAAATAPAPVPVPRGVGKGSSAAPEQKQAYAASAEEAEMDAEMEADADRNGTAGSNGGSGRVARTTAAAAGTGAKPSLMERAKTYRAPNKDFCTDPTKYKPFRYVDPIDEIRESEGGVASDSTDPAASQEALAAVFGRNAAITAQTRARAEAKESAQLNAPTVTSSGALAATTALVAPAGTAGANAFYSAVAPPVIARKTMPHSPAARQQLIALANPHAPAIGSAAAAVKAAQNLMRSTAENDRRAEEDWKKQASASLANRPAFVVNPKTKPPPSKVSAIGSTRATPNVGPVSASASASSLPALSSSSPAKPSPHRTLKQPPRPAPIPPL